MTTSRRTPDDDDDFAYCRRIVDEHIVKYLKWYSRRARYVRYFFRTSGIIVIAASVMIPVLAAVQFSHRDLVIGAAGVTLAVLTGVRNFYRWDRVWSIVKSGEFDLEFMVAQWELELAALAHASDREEASEKAVELTRELLEQARYVVRRVSDDYFSTVAWPRRDSSETPEPSE